MSHVTIPALTLSLLISVSSPASAFDSAVAVHPQFVGEGALTEYMQIAATSTTVANLPAGQLVLFPIAGEDLAASVFTEVCVYVATAGPAGSTLTVPLYELQDSIATLRPYDKVWEGVFPNDTAGRHCLRFDQGTILDPVGNTHFIQWETAPGVVENALVLLWGEVLWKGLVKSSGNNAVATVNNNGVRSLGGSPTVTGAPMRGFRVDATSFPATIADGDLENYSGAVPFIGFRRVHW